MHYFIYPSKDAFITNDPSFVSKNTGLDEILEVEKNTVTNVTGGLDSILSRAILSFDQSALSSSFTTESRYFLVLKTSDSSEVPTDYTLSAYPLASDWVMGTNYKYDGTSDDDGASWLYSNGANQSKWNGGVWYVNQFQTASGFGFSEPPTPSPTPYNPFPNCTSSMPIQGYFSGSISGDVSQSRLDGTISGTFIGSYNTSSLSGSISGSFFGFVETSSFLSSSLYSEPYSGSISGSMSGSINYVPAPTASVSASYACFQTFEYQTGDVRMDITPIVSAWVKNEISNNGLIVLHSGETDSINYGTLKFFSKETNTVYSPYVDVVVNNNVFDTGSADVLPINNTVLSITNMYPEYKFGSVVRFDVSARKRFATRTFTNQYTSTSSLYYLPFDTFYSIGDAQSSNVIVNYDESTRLNYTQDVGNYFFVDTSGLAQERIYTISIRSFQNGSSNTFQIPTKFKVVR